MTNTKNQPLIYSNIRYLGRRLQYAHKALNSIKSQFKRVAYD
jgi:hypothetical protein